MAKIPECTSSYSDSPPDEKANTSNTSSDKNQTLFERFGGEESLMILVELWIESSMDMKAQMQSDSEELELRKEKYR